MVELDGGGHPKRAAYDQARTTWLEERGYQVIRFTNDEVDHELTGVLGKILAKCMACAQDLNCGK